jgi:hypothetical protein
LALADLFNGLLPQPDGRDVGEGLVKPSMKEFAAVQGLALVEEGDEGSWLGISLVLIRLYAKDLKVLVDLGVEVVMREFNLLGERVEDPLMEHLLQQS